MFFSFRGDQRVSALLRRVLGSRCASILAAPETYRQWRTAQSPGYTWHKARDE